MELSDDMTLQIANVAIMYLCISMASIKSLQSSHTSALLDNFADGLWLLCNI